MTRDRMAVFTMQGEDLPQATNRIDLDPHVRDAWGLPAGTGHLRAAPPRDRVRRALGAPPRDRDARRRRDHDVLDDVTPDRRAAWPTGPASRTPISRHIMGGARMGDDPATSVFDRWQRMHGVENVVCTDSSVFPTSTGYGPTLDDRRPGDPRQRAPWPASPPASTRLEPDPHLRQ